MSNTVAIVLGLTLIGLILLDTVMFDAENLLFLAKKLLELIEWIAFWR